MLTGYQTRNFPFDCSNGLVVGHADDFLRVCGMQARKFMSPQPELQHMITKLPESSANIVGFRVQGKLADEDYQQRLLPPIEEAISANQKIRLLFQMENFEGWTAHGAWDDFINWPKFMSVERMAVVVDQNWQEFMTWLFRVASSLTHMEIRFFRTTEMAEAWEWLRSP